MLRDIALGGTYSIHQILHAEFFGARQYAQNIEAERVAHCF